MHRSVGFEFGDQTFGSFDLPSRDVDGTTAAVCRRRATRRCQRNGAARRRWRQRLHRTLRPDLAASTVDSATSRPLDAAALENVVITGGSGAIGLRYAQYCIEHGARRVILLSRNGVDPEVLSRLAGRHSVEVHAPRVRYHRPGRGVGRRRRIRRLRRVVADPYRRNRRDIVGAPSSTGADVAAVCAAKVAGLALMADVWPLQPECRILACSSVFGVWGGHGHAAYAASNRMLDVLAAQLRAKGLDCTAIRWGLWQDAGVVEAAEITRTQRSGLIAMRPEAALDASLGRYDDDPLIFDADFDRLRVFFESQGIPMPFSAPANGDTAPTGNHSAQRPLADVVRTELAATLHLGDSVSIDPSASLIDLGLDSLLALDLRRRLRRAVGHSAPVARMLGGITVNELIDVLRSGSTNGHGHEEGWNPRVTDTTGIDTLDAQRLELLRRRIAERGLARPVAADGR